MASPRARPLLQGRKRACISTFLHWHANIDTHRAPMYNGHVHISVRPPSFVCTWSENHPHYLTLPFVGDVLWYMAIHGPTCTYVWYLSICFHTWQNKTQIAGREKGPYESINVLWDTTWWHHNVQQTDIYGAHRLPLIWVCTQAGV